MFCTQTNGHAVQRMAASASDAARRSQMITSSSRYGGHQCAISYTRQPVAKLTPAIRGLRFHMRPLCRSGISFILGDVWTLLYFIGSCARVIMSSLMPEAVGHSSFDTFKEKFNGYLFIPLASYMSVPRLKSAHYRWESVDSFYTALRIQVKRCDYSSIALED